jgi:hypothetical protein
MTTAREEKQKLFTTFRGRFGNLLQKQKKILMARDLILHLAK